MNNFYLIFIESSAGAYGRDIIHIYLLYVFHVVTVIILFCKHWGSHSAFNFWICILWGPEDDSVGVETFSPCIYGYRYINKRLF